MAMRETEGSLKAYFLLAGGIATLHAVLQLRGVGEFARLPPRFAAALIVPLAVQLVFGIGFVVAGIRLKERLLTDIRWIQWMLRLAIVALVGQLVLTYTALGGSPFPRIHAVVVGSVIQTVIGVAIAWYLLHNLTRLSREARARVPSVFA
jgi:putative effector of murein hydrolase